jgi:diguanylate cyclase (GGDEF)-like protein
VIALRWRNSLRGKLIVACICLMLFSAGLLFFADRQILQYTLAKQSGYQSAQVSTLLKQSIAIPLAQRDYAVLQQTLERLVSAESIKYIVLFDHRGREVANAGWDARLPLPPVSGEAVDLQAADATRHLTGDVSIGGQLLGTLRFGVSVVGLRDAQSTFERRSLAIVAITLLLSIAMIAALATVLTRHLARLERSSQRIAAGDFDVVVPVPTGDEIGRLSISFNRMAITLRDRLLALNASEVLQGQHLQASKAEQARLGTLVNAIPLGILFVDGGGTIQYANGAFITMWALAADPVGSSLIELLVQLRSKTVAADVPGLEYLRRPPLAGENCTDLELRTIGGLLVAQRVRIVAQPDGSNGYLCLHEDMTVARSTQRLAQEALIDPLTQLPNRRGLFEALVAGTAWADERDKGLVLMFIDLDDFKHANDVGGHRMGDEILVSIGACLSAQMRDGDTVARLGGDEFAVICPGISIEEGGIIAARLIDEVARLRFATEYEILRVGCSIGITSYPGDGQTPEELIACADTAMYQVKRKGKNGWLRYLPDPARVEMDFQRINWNGRIHRALSEKRFVLFYQPVFDASDRQVAYHEVLLRMVDEQDSSRLIFPSDFIAHAEASGKIRQIDRWVFEECVKQLAQLPGLTLAANLSARSLDDSSFAGFLRDMFQAHDVDPRRLHIELTETSAIGDPAAAQAMIGRLRVLGCAVHLDDFGSGFSSFSHLKLLEVDTIKIDGAFIRDLDTDRHNQLFVGAIIAIARELNKKTVAEHVENQSTYDLLLKMQIDYVQGFHLARPARTPLAPRPGVLTLMRAESTGSTSKKRL